MLLVYSNGVLQRNPYFWRNLTVFTVVSTDSIFFIEFCINLHCCTCMWLFPKDVMTSATPHSVGYSSQQTTTRVSISFWSSSAFPEDPTILVVCISLPNIQIKMTEYYYYLCCVSNSHEIQYDRRVILTPLILSCALCVCRNQRFQDFWRPIPARGFQFQPHATSFCILKSDYFLSLPSMLLLNADFSAQTLETLIVLPPLPCSVLLLFWHTIVNLALQFELLLI